MRRYSQADEEAIRTRALVREWQRSGLLEASPGALLDAELRVELRRTNPFFRVALFLFTALIVGASVALFLEVSEVHGDRPVAAVCIVAALACFGAAEYLAGRFRLYRFGVEEALATAAALLVSIAAAQIASSLASGHSGRFAIAAGLIAGAVAGFATYLRLGYLYAALGAVACALLLPFETDLSAKAQRVLAALLLACIFAIFRRKRLRHGDDFPGDDYGILQAAAWAGVYVALNLQLTSGRFGGFVYWWTYAMIWLLPIIGLWIALRDKDRALLDVNLAMALVTLATNKPYLGLARQPWDPILFGVLLMGAAIFFRRWLSRGPDGQRHGFTPVRLLTSESRAVSIAGTASAALQPHIPAPSATPQKPEFDGGQSGGGGASSTF